MLRFLHRLSQPKALVGLSVLLLGVATLIVIPLDRNVTGPRPMSLADNEQEIVWLYPATSSTQWERFAKAVEQARERLSSRFPDVQWSNDTADDSSNLVSPSMALTWSNQRLVFRWYKVTSQWTPRTWLDALMQRERPPLAIIGGNNSFWARRLALEMRRLAENYPDESLPLLLLTTATADRVPDRSDEDQEVPFSSGCGQEISRDVPLWSIYRDRTFRFCFTNRQMATAVTRFIWRRPELTPVSDMTYLVRWCDDAYSRDLCEGYLDVLPRRATDSVLPQWAFFSGALGLRLPTPAAVTWYGGGYRHDASLQIPVDSSVGTFLSPNPYEANAVVQLLNKIQPEQRRPLLVLTGQQQPTRRFLRELARSEADTARRFVVALGDAISFNTIYRDRQVSWPIQDLPFNIVLFSHRNPIDPSAGFLPADQVTTTSRSRTSGTEDLLLFRDVVEACALATKSESVLTHTAQAMREGLQKIRIAGSNLSFEVGASLFNQRGQRADGTGEHVVYLSPQISGERVLSQAAIEVWSRREDRTWSKVGESLKLTFNEFEVHRGERIR